MGFIDKVRDELERLERAYAQAKWGSGPLPSPEDFARQRRLLDRLEDIQARYDVPDSVIEAAFFASYGIVLERERHKELMAKRRQIAKKAAELSRLLEDYEGLNPMGLPPPYDGPFRRELSRFDEALEQWGEYLQSPEIEPRQHADKAAFLRAFLSRIPEPKPCSNDVLANIASELLPDPEVVSTDYVKDMWRESRRWRQRWRRGGGLFRGVHRSSPRRYWLPAVRWRRWTPSGVFPFISLIRTYSVPPLFICFFPKK